MFSRVFGLRVRSLLVLLACLVVVSAPSLGGAKGGGNAVALQPDSNAFGKSCGEWAAQWWQWATSIPAEQSPMLDETGEDAARGQSGHVWFLAGLFSTGGTVERDVTVPSGTALFFPVYNWIWVNTPEFGDPEWSPEQEANVRQFISDQVEAATAFSAEIDGGPVDLSARRCRNEEPFMVTVPEGNIFGIPAGTYGPAVTDGYWVMLPPLPPGTHTVHFSSTQGGNTMDVTYNITVKPGKK